MAKSSILVSTLAAALIAGSVGLAYAQGGGGRAGGTAGTAGGTSAAGTNTSSAATQTNSWLSGTTGTSGNPSISTNPGTVGNLSGTTGNPCGGGHRQPKAGDLPRKDRQTIKRDRTERNVDRLIGSICRGC